MARFYVNENFPLPVVEALQAKGHDVLTSLDAGNADKRIPDDEVLRYAIDTNRIMLTLNRKDFIKLHKSNPKHCGIIVCTVDNNFEALAQRVHGFMEDSEMGIKNQLIKIYRPV